MDGDTSIALELHDVRFGYETKPDFLGPITLCVRAGECWALVGPNGAGKSTLLRVMAGLIRSSAGLLHVAGRHLGDLSVQDRAKLVAFLPQHVPTDLTDTVAEIVRLGRHPHRSFGLFESEQDHLEAERAMRVTGTLPFADRSLNTLSGGEAQRVHVAAALAQQARVLLLDEPTASLDIVHQQAIFRVLRQRAMADGIAVVVVTHDVNLAAPFCTHAIVLDSGRVAASGTTADVLTPEILSPVYGLELISISTSDESNRRWLVPVGGQLESGAGEC